MTAGGSRVSKRCFRGEQTRGDQSSHPTAFSSCRCKLRSHTYSIVVFQRCLVFDGTFRSTTWPFVDQPVPVFIRFRADLYPTLLIHSHVEHFIYLF